MSAGTFPAVLNPPLEGREAVADALYRGVLAFDTQDVELFKSALFDDAKFTLFGETMSGFQEIREKSFDHVSKMDTTHYIANVRVNFTGENTAKATATGQGVHYKPGEGMKAGTPFFTSNGFYHVDVAKDEASGLWKIKHWKMEMISTEGDFGVMAR